MLNYLRYTSVYYLKHQWEWRNSVNYKFGEYYKKLFVFVKNSNNCLLCQPDIPICELYENWSDTAIINDAWLKLVVRRITLIQVNKINDQDASRPLSRRFCKKKYVRVVPRNLQNEIDVVPAAVKLIKKKMDFGKFTGLWKLGYKKLSFYTKKTRSYEKNRKVKRDKLFLRFSKLYNFFKNVMNVVMRANPSTKYEVYLYFVKKKYKVSVKYLFKKLATSLVKQKNKPIALEVLFKKK